MTKIEIINDCGCPAEIKAKAEAIMAETSEDICSIKLGLVDLGAEEYSDGIDCGLWLLDLGANWKLAYTDCQGYERCEITQESAYDIIRMWDPGDSDPDEFLVSFGLDPHWEEAEEGYEGECKVWHKPNYYPGTCNAPQPGYARFPFGEWGERNENEGEIIVFDTYAAAKEYVDNYYDEPSTYKGIPACNVLSHGQAGPDNLTIVKA